jgi:hypothetical protein
MKRTNTGALAALKMIILLKGLLNINFRHIAGTMACILWIFAKTFKP